MEEDITFELYKMFLKHNPDNNVYTIDWYRRFQEELGIPESKIVGYGYIEPKLIDSKKLMLFKIKYGN